MKKVRKALAARAHVASKLSLGRRWRAVAPAADQLGRRNVLRRTPCIRKLYFRPESVRGLFRASHSVQRVDLKGLTQSHSLCGCPHPSFTLASLSSTRLPRSTARRRRRWSSRWRRAGIHRRRCVGSPCDTRAPRRSGSASSRRGVESRGRRTTSPSSTARSSRRRASRSRRSSSPPQKGASRRRSSSSSFDQSHRQRHGPSLQGSRTDRHPCRVHTIFALGRHLARRCTRRRAPTVGPQPGYCFSFPLQVHASARNASRCRLNLFKVLHNVSWIPWQPVALPFHPCTLSCNGESYPTPTPKRTSSPPPTRTPARSATHAASKIRRRWAASHVRRGHGRRPRCA